MIPLTRLLLPTRCTARTRWFVEARAAPDPSTRNEHQYARNHQAHCLDIEVTKGQFRRALRIMDALVKAFEARGWRVVLWDRRRPEQLRDHPQPTRF
jgi:hypothetical protein